MVGIILASHGNFAKGILQSGTMIFGEQENVRAVTLMPSEGPNDFKVKLKEAISSLDNQDEVLFLVDLWGGTPFNQANLMIEEHKDKTTFTKEEIDLLKKMISSHMGEWNTNTYSEVTLPKPRNKYEFFVHMCDFLSSKKYLDVKFDRQNNIIL